MCNKEAKQEKEKKTNKKKENSQHYPISNQSYTCSFKENGQ
jgi:hypothetical protein